MKDEKNEMGKVIHIGMLVNQARNVNKLYSVLDSSSASSIIDRVISAAESKVQNLQSVDSNFQPIVGNVLTFPQVAEFDQSTVECLSSVKV